MDEVLSSFIVLHSVTLSFLCPNILPYLGIQPMCLGDTSTSNSLFERRLPASDRQPLPVYAVLFGL